MRNSSRAAFSEKRGSVLWIVMNRPDRLNAINFDLLYDVRELVQLGEKDDSVSAMAIKGEGRAFCAGGDLKEFKEKGEGVSEFINLLAGELHRLIVLLRMCEKPVAAVVKGYASGAGFSLALSCDMAFASEGARFNMAYSRIGLSPDGGGSLFLSRMLGYRKAFQILSKGEDIDAKGALELGLVDGVFPEETIEDDVQRILEGFSEIPRGSLSAVKKLLNASLFPDLFSHLELERKLITEISKTREFKERLSTFFRKKSGS